jgi:hypothetical protein
MSNVTLASVNAQSTGRSLGAKLLDIFVSPGGVFDEVVAGERNLANWRVPTLLACLTGVVLLQAASPAAQTGAAIEELVQGKLVSAAQGQKMLGGWQVLSILTTCVGTFVGTIWSASVIWFIGRLFLKSRFPFLKALEVVGLTGIILVLGSVVTQLLIALSGNPATRPSLGLFAGKLATSTEMRDLLNLMNVFHLWSATVLAIGLSKLSGVGFKESAFWVFGYWIALRIALIVLG